MKRTDHHNQGEASLPACDRSNSSESGSDHLVADEKPLAAYQLGYVNRSVGMWLRFCWEGTRTVWIEDPWGGFPGSIIQLREARRLLACEIHPNVFVELGTVLDKLDDLFERLSEAWDERDESIPWGDGEPPGEDLVLSLRQLVDRALGEEHRLRVWYEFGAALGDFRLGLVHPHRPAPPTPGLETVPDFGPIVRCAGRLPEASVRQVPLLNSLVRLSSCFRREGQVIFLRKFLELNHRAGRLQTRADGPIPLDTLMSEFDPRVQEGLAQLKYTPTVTESEFPDSTGMAGQPARSQDSAETVGPVNQAGQVTVHLPSPEKDENSRNRFMYDQYLKGTTLGTIAEMVAEHKEWDHFDSTSGVLAAIRRFAKKHDLPLPRRQKRK